MNPTNITAELGRRFIYIASLLIVFFSQIWMAVSQNLGDFQGSHVLTGLGAAPFEALVAISVTDVWFVHERGSKLGAYVFGLAFGSFIGPLCSGYMALNQGWRWLYWWGAILSGALGLLFYLTFEESRFIRTAENIEHRADIEEIRRASDVEAPPWQEDSKNGDRKIQFDDDASVDRQVSQEPKVGEVLDAVGFRVQLKIFKLYPDPWREIISQFWRPLKVSVLPAVLWVSTAFPETSTRVKHLLTGYSAASTMVPALAGLQSWVQPQPTFSPPRRIFSRRTNLVSSGSAP